IRWGSGDWPESIHASRLAEDSLFPVCSPLLIARHRISDPNDLSGTTLLQEVSGSSWASWLDHAHCKQTDFATTLYFSDANLSLEAAAQGQGVCITNNLLAADDLRSGRLVKPFDNDLKLGRADYYILTSATENRSQATSDFCRWLK